MSDYEILFVHRTGKGKAEKAISRLCGQFEGRPFSFPVQRVVDDIELRRNRYHIRELGTGRRLYFGVICHRGQPAYLKVHVNGCWNSQLAKVLECNGSCGWSGDRPSKEPAGDTA